MLRILSYVVRGLSRTPAVTLTIVLTVAGATGATVAVFAAIDTILLRPLPFPGSERLVYVTHTNESQSVRADIPPIRLLDWNERNSTFEAIATYRTDNVTDTSGDRPELVRRASITPGFLDVWGIAPALGRGFTDEEFRFGGPAAVLISHAYWQARMNANAAAVGETIALDGQEMPVVGVLPAAFSEVDPEVDIWSPHRVDAPWAVSRESGWFAGAVGRLRAEVTLEEARQDLDLVQDRLAEAYPATDRDIAIELTEYKETVVGAAGASLWMLLAAVAVLLLIACTNIAALLLARGVQRRRDTAIRYSLGASRRAIVSHLLTETFVLVGVGAIVGLALSSLAVSGLSLLAPDMPRVDDVSIDSRVVLFAALLTVAVVFLCGLLPALRGTRASALVVGGDRTQVAPSHSLNWSLVGVQVTLSVSLLLGAGLLLRSFDALSRIDAGFDAAQVLTFRLSGSRDAVSAEDVQRIDRVLEGLSALPDVEAAATSFGLLPGVHDPYTEELSLVEGAVASRSPIVAETRTVSPSYFETMQIPLLEGEMCRQPGNESVEAVVNRSFARTYFPGRSPIGLRLAGDTPERIVGIVGDARELGLHRAPIPTVYPCFNAGSNIPWFLMRTRGDPTAAVESIRARLAELEPLRSVYDIRPLDSRIGDVYGQNRLQTRLLSLFSLAALSLVCVGIYGTLSYILSLRWREVGLRVALGALPGTIVAQQLSKTLRVVAIAGVIGVAFSLAFARGLSSMLYGVSPSDPVVLASVCAIVLLVSGLAAFVPAARASRIDPMQALRED